MTLMGCASENVPGSTSRLLRYSVDFNNVGLKLIDTSIILCKDKESSFAAGVGLLSSLTCGSRVTVLQSQKHSLNLMPYGNRHRRET